MNLSDDGPGRGRQQGHVNRMARHQLGNKAFIFSGKIIRTRKIHFKKMASQASQNGLLPSSPITPRISAMISSANRSAMFCQKQESAERHKPAMTFALKFGDGRTGRRSRTGPLAWPANADIQLLSNPQGGALLNVGFDDVNIERHPQSDLRDDPSCTYDRPGGGLFHHQKIGRLSPFFIRRCKPCHRPIDPPGNQVTIVRKVGQPEA